ncbi:GNAT family N-acetyltransferase [Cellulomonas wangsupingiae]|uniref:GNAT family N-acetyltransferase n=1 Tax=Cellulomonas wangsupingiae TaxID=2968085 RepID=UPI0035565A7E
MADDDGDVIGHVAFSPVTIDGSHDGWFGLGPISVRLDRRRQGIGRALVAEGLHRLRARGARGCRLIGDPNIYSRMSFTSNGSLSHMGLDRSLVQQITFSGLSPRGELRFATAFGAGGSEPVPSSHLSPTRAPGPAACSVALSSTAEHPRPGIAPHFTSERRRTSRSMARSS